MLGVTSVTAVGDPKLAVASKPVIVGVTSIAMLVVPKLVVAETPVTSTVASSRSPHSF